MIEQKRGHNFPQYERSRESVFNGLQRKVDILRSFKSGIEDISVHDSHTDIANRVDTLMDLSTQQFPEDTQQKYYLVSELIGPNPFPAFIDPLDLQFDEIRELLSDEDVLFLVNLLQMTTDLTEKNNIINQIKDDPNAIRELVKFSCNNDLQWELVQNVVVDPFSISLIIQYLEMSRISKIGERDGDDIGGLHFSETPINFIRQMDPESIERIIYHENIHNLLDNVTHIPAARSYQLISQISNQVIRFNSAKEDNLPEEIIDTQRKLLREGLSPNIIINALHNELLAHIKNLEDNNFKNRSTDQMKPSPDVDPEKFSFFESARNFSTAGRQIIGVIELLDALVLEYSGEEIGELCENALQKNMKAWLAVTSEMKQALEIGTRISEDAHTDVHLLFYILKPTQFRYVQRYLEQVYGKDSVKMARESIQIVDSFQFDRESFEHIVSALPDITNRLLPLDREILLTNLIV